MNELDCFAFATQSNLVDNMKKRLSKALVAAIKAYLDHRDNQSNVKWDKNADENNITKVAFADRFVRVEQCCGTWWFSVKRGKSIWVFQCHEDNYTTTLLGEKKNVASNALSTLLRAA